MKPEELTKAWEKKRKQLEKVVNALIIISTPTDIARLKCQILSPKFEQAIEDIATCKFDYSYMKRRLFEEAQIRRIFSKRKYSRKEIRKWQRLPQRI